MFTGSSKKVVTVCFLLSGLS